MAWTVIPDAYFLHSLRVLRNFKIPRNFSQKLRLHLGMVVIPNTLQETEGDRDNTNHLAYQFSLTYLKANCKRTFSFNPIF